jgi:hypothetical protein
MVNREKKTYIEGDKFLKLPLCTLTGFDLATHKLLDGRRRRYHWTTPPGAHFLFLQGWIKATVKAADVGMYVSTKPFFTNSRVPRIGFLHEKINHIRRKAPRICIGKRQSSIFLHERQFLPSVLYCTILKLEAEFCFFQTGKMFLEIGGLYLKIRL